MFIGRPRSAVRVVVTVLDTMIVRVVVTVAGTDRAFHWLKNLVLHRKHNSHAGEELPHRWVVADSNLARDDLHRHVEVANLPTGLGRLGGVAGQADGQHRLGRLPDAVAMAFRLEKNRVMLERLGQVEAEISAVTRFAAPTALLQLEPVSDQLDLGQPCGTWLDGLLDELHVKKGNNAGPGAAPSPVRR